MVRYFGGWIPLVVVGAIFILSAPWLALIALVAVALVALATLAALAWVAVYVPYHVLSLAISRRSHSRIAASQVTAPSPAASHPAFRKGYVA